MALLSVRDISKSYRVPAGIFAARPRLVRAVRSVSLDIEPGTAVGLVGESGSGKSTLARLILKLIDADGGSLVFQGNDITAWPESRLRPLRRNLQIVFQDPTASLSPRLRVRDIVAEPLQAAGEKRAAIRRRVEGLLAQVGLHVSHLDRLPHQLSGGERQRVSIARALATDPKLVVLDEAVSSLDVSTQAQILNLLKDLQAARNLAYLFIGHNLTVVRFLCHEVAVMYQGSLVEYGPTEEVYGHPAHPYTRLLLRSMPKLRGARLPDASPETTASGGSAGRTDQAPDICAGSEKCRDVEPRCGGEPPPCRIVGPRHFVWCWHEQ